MNYDDRMAKLKNGSDTARWAAQRIEKLEKELINIKAGKDNPCFLVDEALNTQNEN